MEALISVGSVISVNCANKGGHNFRQSHPVAVIIDGAKLTCNERKSYSPNMPLLGELSRSSWDSFESDSDSKESRDVQLKSFKSGILIFKRVFSLRFFDSIDSIDWRFEKIIKFQNATFWRITPIVPGFVQIGIRSGRIPGRSA